MTFQISATLRAPAPDIARRIDVAFSDLDRAIQPAYRKSLNSVYRKLTRYPKRPIGSTYQRTGRLRRSWKVNLSRRSVRSAGVPYASFVQSSTQQARVHRGRWTTETQAVEREMPSFKKNVDIELKRHFRQYIGR